MTQISRTNVVALVLLTGLPAASLVNGDSTTSATSPPSAPPIATDLALPEPTGPHPVGLTNLRIAQPIGPELTVTLWYPAIDDAGPDAMYVTPERSREIMASRLGEHATPEILSTTRTHATADAEPLDESLPLVVVLAGLNQHGTSMGGLALDLGSRGYAVATVDWSSATPQVANASTVLDDLLASTSIRIDSDQVAVVGHSAGGEAAALVVRTDPRFRAGISFDSTFPPDITADVATPFMMLDSPIYAYDNSSTNWLHLTGWRRWYIINGSTHSSFTDYQLLFEQLGLPGYEGATISGARASSIVRSYVAAFVDLHLRGVPQPLLEPPQFPDVIFRDPPQPAP